jgi:hypothetical protein
MTTVDAGVHGDPSTDAHRPGRNLRLGWTIFTILLAGAFFLEAVFAGSILSGAPWARKAHAVTAMILIASASAGALVGLVTLRRVRRGPRVGLILLSLAAAALVQGALGAMSAKGANLTWIHVPLGVALVSLAGLAVLAARGLGRDV